MKISPNYLHRIASSTDSRRLLRSGLWRKLLPCVCLGSLTACMASPSYQTDLPSGSSSADANAATYSQSPSPSPSPSPSSQFSFPMTSCGDRTDQPSGSWYSVFIDGANVDDIRARYCGDAVSVTRAKSGQPTVQAASFTSYARALTLAKAIGGVVEQATAAAENKPAADQPAASSPAPAPTASTAQVGQSAYLNASESGVPINIRTNASTSAQVQSMGYPGDPVKISSTVQGDDGFTWYEVQLASGTTGWVRGDLVSTQAPDPSQAPSQAPSQDPAAARDYASSDEVQPPNDSQAPAQAPSQPPYQQPYNQSPYNQSPYNQSPYQSPYNQAPDQQSPPYALQPNGQAPYGRQPYTQQPGQAPYAQSPYGQSPSGQPPYGPPGRGQGSTLTSREPGSAINIREFASMNSKVRYRGNPGDPVQVSGSAQGDDGFTWYQVRFSSGAAGWVRGDLLAGN